MLYSPPCHVTQWVFCVCVTDKVIKQDREIREMKQKIAEVMAVSPGVSYMAPRPPVPQYLTKLLNSERYMLTPRALMYQCLKKWRYAHLPGSCLPESRRPRWLTEFVTETRQWVEAEPSTDGAHSFAWHWEIRSLPVSLYVSRFVNMRL